MSTSIVYPKIYAKSVDTINGLYTRVEILVSIDDSSSHQQQLISSLLNILELSSKFDPALSTQRSRVVMTQIYSLLKSI